ncbi:MAG TPA: hypothetical protein VNC40_11050 [Gaiellaceae bacterium]|nr:hypothetical protein [Gaiellaceae bacterium]
MKNRLLPTLIVSAALAALAGTVTYAVAHATGGGNNNYGSMMNGGGYTMMGASGPRTAWYVNGSGPVANIAAARSQAQRFAGRLGLKTGEVMQFADNFYVLLTDSQGKPATEVLVDPATGAVTLEYGPAMMWNTRYGMMGGTGTAGYGGMVGGGNAYGGMMGGRGAGMDGMMGRYGGSPNWTPPSGNLSAPLTASGAQRIANEWLAGQKSGLTAAQPDTLPGYFTLDTLKDGKITGMLSVNEQTGAVWYHWWHGRFVAMEE